MLQHACHVQIGAIMPKTLRFDVELSDGYIEALEIVKSLLMTDKDTGITHASSTEKVYCALASVGLGVMLEKMTHDGTYEKHREEVELGNAVDDLLK